MDVSLILLMVLREWGAEAGFCSEWKVRWETRDWSARRGWENKV